MFLKEEIKIEKYVGSEPYKHFLKMIVKKGGMHMEKRENSRIESNQVKFKETSVKVMDFVRNLHDCILDSEDVIKEKYSGDIMELINCNTFNDTKDRVDFCIQFIQWVMASDFINKSTKDYIRAHNESLRVYFNKRNNLIARRNINVTSIEEVQPLENINTCISRVTADTNKLKRIIDEEIYNYIFCYEGDGWKRYYKNFLAEVKKYSYMTINDNAFLFNMRKNIISCNAPKRNEFMQLLDTISVYSTKKMDKVINKIQVESWGYFNYLCSCKPQKKVDRDNYKLLQEVIEGTYESNSEQLLKSLEIVQNELKNKEEQLKSLEEREKELNAREELISKRENNLETYKSTHAFYYEIGKTIAVALEEQEKTGGNLIIKEVRNKWKEYKNQINN